MYRIVTIFLILLCQTTFAADTLSITNAIDMKRIVVAAFGNGGLGNKAVRLIIKNNITADLFIRVPAGVVLNSEDPRAQDLIILEERYLMAQGRAISTFDFFGACTQLSNYAPKKEEKYKLGGMAPDALYNLAQIINDNKLQSSIGQGAIWAYTDNKPIDNVFHPDYVDASWDMAKIIAEYRRENPPTRAQIVAAPRPATRVVFSARADMVYHAPREMQVELALYDSLGNNIRQYFPLKTVQGGLLLYTIGVNNILEQNTTYFVRLKDQDGNVLKEISLSNNQLYEETIAKRQRIEFEYINRQNAINTMTLEDADGNLIQELAKNRRESISKRKMNLELLHAFPEGTPLQIKVTRKDGSIVHVEQIRAN